MKFSGHAKAGLWAVLFGLPRLAGAYEEPRYAVELTDGPVEIRRYEARIAVETTATGSASKASNQAFMRLFDYIGGANQGSTEVAMTIPVTTVRETNDGQGEKIAMTVPVTMAAASESTSDSEIVRMQFFLPSNFTMETAPKPSDSRVKLRQEPAVRMAALRYSGDYSKPRYEKNLGKLRKWLNARGLSESAAPMNAVYNGPFTPGFLRRNEVLIPIADGEPLSVQDQTSSAAPGTATRN